MTGLYIHIPFCKRKCFYCDFVSVKYNTVQSEEYISAVIKEAQKYSSVPVSTIYIGGGTPSVLSVQQMERLIRNIKMIFDISTLEEFTVELNPESTTPDKLQMLYDQQVSRLSFGLQSPNNNLLKELGRLHNFEKFKEAYCNSVKKGFDNINIDLIYGIQNQTMNDWMYSLDTVLSFDSKHVSLYPLTIEEGTFFYDKNIKTNNEMQRIMYKTACDKFKNNNFEHYEISNWAKDRKYSKHNITYWKNREYIGLGPSAASYYQKYRFKNTVKVEEYIENINNGKNIIIEKEYINDSIYNIETIMLGLRLSEGVDIKYFKEKKDIIEQYLKEGFIRIKDNKVSLTEESFFISNSLISDLI